jgi:sporulation protein YlmC with PRC-barrel domain
MRLVKQETRSKMSQKSQVGSPGTTVRRHMLLSAAMLLGGGLLAFPVRAGQLVAVDVKPLAEAYRASRLIGATVQNDKNEKIGVVDDLIVTPNDQVLFAVISVGGFLGLGRRFVAVPYSSLTVDDQGHKLVLPGATKDALSKLPEFHYA